jgi:hypothetical protein
LFVNKKFRRKIVIAFKGHLKRLSEVQKKILKKGKSSIDEKLLIQKL